MIVLDNVCKTYSTGVSALNGVNLRIHKGEFVFIVGSSGSGKTTLFKLLLKELEPTSGRIYTVSYTHLTHEQLLESCEAYQEIAKSQLSESELKGGRAS